MANSARPAQGNEARKEPRLVFAVRHNDLAGKAPRFPTRPFPHSGPQIRRTVVVTVKQDQDGTASRLPQRGANRSLEAVPSDQPGAGQPERRANTYLPATGGIHQTAEENR